MMATPARTVTKRRAAARPIPHVAVGPVIPGEDEAEGAGRFAALEAELAPDGDALSLILARQVATLSVRSDRAFRHETAATAMRVRHAVADHDEARHAAADRLFAALTDDRDGNGRRLRALPEGCDLLLAALRTLLTAASGELGRMWTSDHAATFDRLVGGRTSPLPAGPELLARIEAELARVEAHRATLDHAALALDRAEAAERALLDDGPAGVRARRHASAVERSLFRALGELRAIRRERRAAPPPPSRPEPGPARPASPARDVAPAPTDGDPLASFFPAGLPATRPADFVPLNASAPPRPAGREPILDRRKRPKLPR